MKGKTWVASDAPALEDPIVLVRSLFQKIIKKRGY